MEQVSSPLPFTNEAIGDLNNGSVTFEEAIDDLNNGSVTFEEAAALFNVDLSTFKEMLRELGIFFWMGPNGSLVRIDGDYDITIYLKGMLKRFVVKATDSFEDVIRMLEKQLNLSPGCYKLTYKHFNRRVGKVWVKTARDWDSAVVHSKMRGYIVLLHLEVFTSSQTADEDACDEDACDDDACDDGACDEGASDEDACDEDACDDDACDDDACDEPACCREASVEGPCDDDLTDDDFYIDDLDEDNYETFFAFNEDVFDEVSGNSMEHITKECILSLNDGSVNFEQAPALFNVDLSTFKARLEQLNIFVWKEVNGSLVRIHGGDYELRIYVKTTGQEVVVEGTDAFEDVIRMLEARLGVSPGCYKLTFKHPDRSKGNVLLKTDREWHFAVSLSKLRGYVVLLYLERDEDAHDKRPIKKLKRA